MNRFDTIDDPRRRVLVEALAAGVFSGGLVGWSPLFAQIVTKLPLDRPIFRGTGTVNGQPTTRESQIRPGDTLRTGKDSDLVAVVGDCAILLRAESELGTVAESGSGGATRLGGLRLLAGKLLAVFAPGPVRIQTATATVQIRGTGVYVESEPNLTYFCTCFGVTEVAANDDPDSRETVVATHHNKPLYIVGGANNRGNSIAGAPFKDHTDQELALIEALVGRTLPPEFAFPAKDYDPSRTRYGR